MPAFGPRSLYGKPEPGIRPHLVSDNSIKPAIHIPTLPEEILQLIIEGLGNSTLGLSQPEEALHRSTLIALCLTSRQCLRIAQPILYRTLRLTSRSTQLSGIACVAFAARISAVSKALALSPGLPHLVRHLCVEDLHLSRNDQTLEFAAEYSPQAELLQRAYSDSILHLWTLGFQFDLPSLLAELKDGSEDAHLTFIVMRCRNLATLSIDVPLDFGDSWASRFLRQAAEKSRDQQQRAESHVLPHLRELIIQKPVGEGRKVAAFHRVADILNLSSLTSLRGSAVNLTATATLWWMHPKYNLRTIMLQDSVVDAGGLRKLLCSCEKLTSLLLGWDEKLVGHETVELAKISEILCRYGRRLEFLELVFPRASPRTEDPMFKWSRLGSLRDLQELKELRVPAVALFRESETDEEDDDDGSVGETGEGQGDDSGEEDAASGDGDDGADVVAHPAMVVLEDMLPDTLETLHIAGSTEDGDEAMLEDAFARLPNLRTITVDKERWVRPKKPKHTSRLRRNPISCRQTWRLRMMKQKDGTIAEENMFGGYPVR